MKRYTLILLVVTIVTPLASAQRGRILRRLVGPLDAAESETDESPEKNEELPEPANPRFQGNPKPLAAFPKTRQSLETPVTRSVKHDGFGISAKLEKDHVIVTKVEKSSTAAAAGIKKGDVIESVASIPIQLPSDLGQLDSILEEGDEVEFEIQRKGKVDKKSVAFKRQLDESEFEPQVAAVDQGTPNEAIELQAPTMASRGNDPNASALPAIESRQVDIERLTRIIELQQTAIESLRSRVEVLESQATMEDARTSRASKKRSRK